MFEEFNKNRKSAVLKIVQDILDAPETYSNIKKMANDAYSKIAFYADGIEFDDAVISKIIKPAIYLAVDKYYADYIISEIDDLIVEIHDMINWKISDIEKHFKPDFDFFDWLESNADPRWNPFRDNMSYAEWHAKNKPDMIQGNSFSKS
jgi:hypothetical protein